MVKRNRKHLVYTSRGTNYTIDYNMPRWNDDGTLNARINDDVVVTANPDDVARGRARRWFEEFNATPTDKVNVAGGKAPNQFLEEKAIRGAKQSASWMREHPYMNAMGMALGATPFAIAAYPFAASINTGAMINSGRNILTPGSSFWTNPLTTNMMRGMASGY